MEARQEVQVHDERPREQCRLLQHLVRKQHLPLQRLAGDQDGADLASRHTEVSKRSRSKATGMPVKNEVNIFSD